jgi:uncharacterized protein involved in exopolysaccharide biosynthesis
MPDLTDPLRQQPGNNHALDLADILKAFWRKRFLIAVTAVIFGALGIIDSLIQPVYYMAKATIIPPVSEQGPSGLSLGLDLPFDLSSSLLGSMGSEKDKAERYVRILESDRLRLAIIDSFDLVRRYGFGKGGKPFFIEDVLRTFNKKAVAMADKGSVTMAVFDKSPAAAAAIVNFMVCMLDSINKEISRTHMGRKKEFLYQRMIENRDSLAHSENRLLDFQKEHGIIDIQKQAEVSVSAIVRTEADILVKELQLSMNESKFSESTTGIFEQKNDIKALRDRLLNHEMKTGASLLISPKKIPDEAMRLVRLQRAVAVNDILDKYITKAYEEARLEERNTVPTIAVLDPARVPQKKYKPQRRKIVTMFLGMGIGLGLLLAVLFDRFEPFGTGATQRSRS